MRVSSDLSDGVTVGVGEPIVLNFSPSPTDSAAFTKAVTVTVDGKPASGAWYWEQPYADEPMQAHYREQGYWPPDSTIQVKLPIAGLSAGAGLVYSGALTSVTFHPCDAHISTVNGATLQMTVTSNGHLVRQPIPVSLGTAKAPTFNGIKVVMQKGEDTPGTNTLRPNGFYNFSLLGDIVIYVNAGGTTMNPLDGLGDWNTPWQQWIEGGLLLNH